jgi:hypothetical protein
MRAQRFVRAIRWYLERPLEILFDYVDPVAFTGRVRRFFGTSPTRLEYAIAGTVLLVRGLFRSRGRRAPAAAVERRVGRKWLAWGVLGHERVNDIDTVSYALGQLFSRSPAFGERKIHARFAFKYAAAVFGLTRGRR